MGIVYIVFKNKSIKHCLIAFSGCLLRHKLEIANKAQTDFQAAAIIVSL
nr:hypothetical protein [uncultured Kingella sp.]